jgi:putative thioredoxin
LARVNVDVEAAIAQAFRVEAIPTVIALIAGQPIPLFQGAQPEAQIRLVLDQLLKIAAEQGLPGAGSATAAGADSAQSVGQADDPRYDQAYDAFEVGDWDRAAAAYQSLLDDDPSDDDALAGLNRVKLMRRVEGQDPIAAISRAQADPADVSAAVLAADIEMLSGATRSAFDRLIAAVRLTSGTDRTQARDHLLGLFEMVGPADPEVPRARSALASALF